MQRLKVDPPGTRTSVSPEVRYELSFWLNNIVYSDASDSGFDSYFVQFGLDLVPGVWSHDEMQTSWIMYLIGGRDRCIGRYIGRYTGQYSIEYRLILDRV